jgi:type VI secretion system protein ImpH
VYDPKITLSPLKKLLEKPQLFEFFQAVRLLERSVMEQKNAAKYAQAAPQEIMRFRSAPALSFPVSAIKAIQLAAHSRSRLNELEVSFIGLFGAGGVLPNHYTELIIRRAQAKDTALKDFLDIFNHRIISLFYRSWEKRHFYIGYENAQSRPGKRDHFTQALTCLIGNGAPQLQERSVISDEKFLFYAGLFARLPRSAMVLQMLLADCFAAPVEVMQFQGKWLAVAPKNCTRLLGREKLLKAYNQLGRDTLLGQRTWDTQQCFRLCIGPLSHRAFKRFLPDGDQLPALIAMTRRYIGANFNFDVQLVLHAEETPFCQLTPKKPLALGWNMWLKNTLSKRDAKETILNISKNQFLYGAN